MLNKSVSKSRKLASLPDSDCMLLASWLIAHLDYNGVFNGDPTLVKSYVLPRRDDITIEQVGDYLLAMAEVQLIVIFHENGEDWIWFPGFAHNQVGLRQYRERQSDYPAPPVELEEAHDWLPKGSTRDGIRLPEVYQVIDKGTGGKPKPRRKPKPKPVESAPGAAKIYQSVFNRYPKKTTWDQLLNVVGEDQGDLDRWKEILSRWLFLGWSEMNLAGMMDHFVKGTMPGEDHPSQSGKGGRKPKGKQAVEELAKQEGWDEF
jgi:hypothetical protein